MEHLKFPTAHETAVRAKLIDKKEEEILLESIFSKHAAFLKQVANRIDKAADLQEDSALIEDTIPLILSTDSVLQNLCNAYDSISSLTHTTETEQNQAEEVLKTLNKSISSHVIVALGPIENYLHHQGYETEVETFDRELASLPIVRLCIYWNHLTL